jgi:ABC-type uncharacterized transport system substrate-binding protein
MRRLSRTSRKILFACVIVAGASAPAAAHPHVFVKARSAIVFDSKGRITDIRHVWQFDPAFSAFATMGFDKNGDGKLSSAELAPLAKVNVTSLSSYDFFTWLRVRGKDVKLKFPDRYFLRFRKDRLTLYYELPLVAPIAPGAKMTMEVFDPQYFVAFTFAKKNPITLYGAPRGCTASYEPPHQLSWKIMAALAAIPVSQHDLPPALQKAAAPLANVIKVLCP